MTFIRANFYINSIFVNPPVGWEKVKIIATFDAITNSSQIDTDRMEFVLDAAQLIIKYFNEGSGSGRGVTEGLPFKVELESEDGSQSVFNGYIDFFKGYKQINNQRVLCTVTLIDDITKIKQDMEGTTVDLLISKGILTKSDLTSISYVVEKEVGFLELAVLLLTIYMLLKEIYEAALRLANTIATIAGILAGGITGSIGALVFAGIQILADLAYIALMVIQVINMIKELFSLFLSPKRKINCISLHNLLSKAVGYLGYTFSSDIEELTKYYYVPSLKNDNPLRGLPNVTDYGYKVSQMLDLCEKMFYAKIIVKDNVLHLNWKGSSFWEKQSSWVINKQSPDKRSEFEININDITSVDFFNFQTDISDVYTSKNFKGTNYEVTTEQVSVGNRKMVGIKGFIETIIPLALGTSKTKLNDVEKTLVEVDNVADDLLSVFGQSSGLGESIESRLGSLKISEEEFNTPKLIFIRGGKIPNNQRDKLSAKFLWEKYHSIRSFTTSDTAQKLLYTDTNYPLTFREYNLIFGNNEATDWEGRKVTVTKMITTFDADSAELEFSVDHRYTNNLKETKIEG